MSVIIRARVVGFLEHFMFLFRAYELLIAHRAALVSFAVITVGLTALFTFLAPAVISLLLRISAEFQTVFH